MLVLFRLRSVPDQTQSAIPHAGIYSDKIRLIPHASATSRRMAACTMSTSAKSSGKTPAKIDVTGTLILLSSCYANQSGGAEIAGNMAAYRIHSAAARPRTVSHLVTSSVKRQNSLLAAVITSDVGEMPQPHVPERRMQRISHPTELCCLVFMDDHLSHPVRPPSHVILLLMAILNAGCVSTSGREAPRTNALLIPLSSTDATWERAVSVLHRNHFLIARESKLEGIIETEYRAGSNVLEPWHSDSVGLDNRLESTLQSIRRKVIISFAQSGADQLMVSVQAHKEIEDVPGPTATYAGGATFSESEFFDRDLNQVLGQSSPSRWLPRGRDAHLEARLVAQLQGSRP